MSKHKQFWNKEYTTGGHIKLSDEPAEDLVTFDRWIGRNGEDFALTNETTVLDLGCGNGRNLIHLAREYGCKGIGTDISEEALSLARKAGKGLKLEFVAHSVNEPLH